MFNTCLFKQGRNFYNALVKNNVVNMSANKKRFTVLNENEMLPKEVKMTEAVVRIETEVS